MLLCEPALTAPKVQLRLAGQRLRELQDRNDSQGFIIRKDTATLLRQQKVWLARAKAHKYLVDGIFTNLLERLEMHIKVLLEYFNAADLRCVYQWFLAPLPNLNKRSGLRYRPLF